MKALSAIVALGFLLIGGLLCVVGLYDIHPGLFAIGCGAFFVWTGVGMVKVMIATDKLEKK